MTKEKLVWIRCEDIQTERRVKEVLDEARKNKLFPSHIHCILSYGNEIEFMPPKEFIRQLENVVNELKIIVSTKKREGGEK